MTNSYDPTEAAADAIGAGDATAIPTAGGVLNGIAGTALQGSAIAKAACGLAAEVARIALGRSEVTPSQSDWRFKDPTWSENALYKRLAQVYLATCAAADSVVADMDDAPAERARFAMNIIASALAPTNGLIGNPAALKMTLESGGANLVRGAKNFLHDLSFNGGMPSSSKAGVLTVGEHMALSPGRVIHRDHVAEVLQYAPSTETVRERPVLFIPPPIGRFYFLDLRPGRSLVEHAVNQGLQPFMISWRNPSSEQSDWDMDTYAERILSAIEVVRETTGAEDVNLIGFCAGGILMTTVLNYLASRGDTRVHSASYCVTMMQYSGPAAVQAFRNARLISFAKRNSAKSGIITARAMSSAFTWMRPNDLVWNYWVNNYLLGQDPPVFDILAWNADGTNLPAKLHEQFLSIFEGDLLPTRNAVEVLSTPIELNTIKVQTYVVGAINDHLTPWRACYATTQLLAGDSTFVLSNAGHIASLVNPPGNPKASYFTGPHDSSDSPDEWLQGAEQRSGSWWEHWTDWLIARSGDEVAAPTVFGSQAHPPVAEAPGGYVRSSN